MNDYLSAVPEGGWTDEYKTTKLVLRRIEPGTFLMGGSYQTTLTKSYYMGVFEVTQKQYGLVTGNNPSVREGDKRPVDRVSWNVIRGYSGWPDLPGVSPDSFMGRLRARTGLEFDLPTEAQWEYACRAGTTSAFNNGGNSEDDMNLLGRYANNRYDGKGGYSGKYEHTTVGSYLPNAWGLYDMHGNVWEWCLDWDGDLTDGQVDPKGPSCLDCEYRITRGGCLLNSADECSSANRSAFHQTAVNDYSWGLCNGFRLAGTLSPGKVVQTMSFDTIGVQTAESQVTLSATTTSGGAVTYEVVSGPGRIEGDELSFTGTGTVVVRASQAGDDLWLPVSATQKVTVIDADKQLYMVVDISAGSGDAVYPVSYLTTVPEGGWTDEYKTTKLVLRRIEPGTFMMGSTNAYDYNPLHQVTLTQPYYMGVFEVTQKQYELVTGNNPSGYQGDKRPVENVSWNTVRGDSDTYNWPNSSAVDANSFMGQLRARTGLKFDLPTEAQWEYACRAGTMSDYNNGGNSVNDLKQLGRYNNNCSDGKGGYTEHTTVGSYLPNAWGLYDMHGNVWEWCLDCYGRSLEDGVADPVGTSSGSGREIRGGGFISDAIHCRSAFRNSYASPAATDFGRRGFRLASTLSE